MTNSDITRVAREAFGWPELREGQEETVEALLAGRDVIAVMPTGSGKSAIYLLAGTMGHGVTVVVSPLIALQADQLAKIADSRGAPGGVAVNSTLGENAVEDAWRSLEMGSARFLFVAPEQLAKDEVVDRIRSLDVALFVIDEAHCVASWGHDFRPDYLTLGNVRDRIGRPPIAALTATGAEPVRVEIAERLGLADPLVVVRGVDRPNIDFEVRRESSAAAVRNDVLDAVSTLPRPGLLYVGTRRQAEEYAAELQDRGISAEAYHAGVRAKERRRVHEAFLADETDVVVATNAFGMGIDKPNVRFVVHATVPESLDAYYQEIGRAGRDGGDASAILFYRSEDLGLRKFFVSRTADESRLADAYAAVGGADAPVRARDLAKALQIPPRAATGLLNLLVEGGAVRTTRDGATPVGRMSKAEAARAAADASDRRERIESSRLEVMRRYAETRDCRRRNMLAYFGEILEQPCGHCDTCRAGTADEFVSPEDEAADTPFPHGSDVVHTEWGPGKIVEEGPDRVTVFFDDQGYKVLDLQSVIDHDILRAAGPNENYSRV